VCLKCMLVAVKAAWTELSPLVLVGDGVSVSRRSSGSRDVYGPCRLLWFVRCVRRWSHVHSHSHSHFMFIQYITRVFVWRRLAATCGIDRYGLALGARSKDAPWLTIGRGDRNKCHEWL
jgi:hypothetical protein